MPLPLWARVLILIIIAVATAKGCSCVGDRRIDRPRSADRPGLFRPRATPSGTCPCPTVSCTRPHRVLPILRPHPAEEVVDELQPMTEDELRQFLDDVKRHKVSPVPPTDAEAVPTDPVVTTTSLAPVTTTTAAPRPRCPGGVCPTPARGLLRRR